MEIAITAINKHDTILFFILLFSFIFIFLFKLEFNFIILLFQVKTM
ncbi:hypothetical protein RUMHYD_00007 [Blautia hydrogenotrophica DSM 10507]|uniref:Uncharacterized protein n=1 Tax=Blautia hydrogenotrophica (strain DSM 10507 / JCM 14656 / S5a33) TaxID=476272 RepID=C0CGP3_BLAHS|nr:hypothetical protein RUMHYD_00007 [Blautia hydrogenotrophica DSM 10507]